MSDTTERPKDSAELTELVNASFPDLRCLRCGYDRFFLAADVDALAAKGENRVSVLALQGALADPQHARHPVLTLACTRCGHIEQHLTGMLRRAEKPIIKPDR